ncbi:RNA-binding protein [Mariprofundus sp. EBB-1]|uniref:RNA recognition motif domain-containing protein n=1 Tax=Mariprofundus sp. EBB-1 TaxID=2650971 RepID=UPI000EF18E04|nr:RNA-binding protein [Mariprofundus sp. EBB-1]RLL52750.1 RNA-binding protein [Mariprofundus sp. EBB-1]
MSSTCFVKLLAVSLVVSLVGYLLGNMFGFTGVPAGSVLATGLFIGTVFGGLLVALAPKAGEKNSNSNDAANAESRNIYVGNLPFNAGEDDIKNIFSPYGDVLDIRLVKDRRSKRFKGYGFVEMSANGAKAAIEHLDGTDYAGRTLRINEAKKKED